MIFPEKLNFTQEIMLNYPFFCIVIKGAIEVDNDNTEHMELFSKHMSAQQLWSHKLKKSGAIVGFQKKKKSSHV